jgi:hypothetical protein
MQKQSANPNAEMAPKRNFFMICAPDATFRREAILPNETHQSLEFHEGTSTATQFLDTFPYLPIDTPRQGNMYQYEFEAGTKSEERRSEKRERANLPFNLRHLKARVCALG